MSKPAKKQEDLEKRSLKLAHQAAGVWHVRLDRNSYEAEIAQVADLIYKQMLSVSIRARKSVKRPKL